MQNCTVRRPGNMIWEKNNFTLHDDRSAVDIAQLHALLTQTYWARNRTLEQLKTLVAHSTCFTLLKKDELVGFVRVTSDFASMSWISDMIVADAYRGMGLGHWMMQCVLTHPDFANTQFALQTLDAHAFYEKLGFARRETLMSTKGRYSP